MRWIVGHAESRSRETRRIDVLVGPARTSIETNLVINTGRRSYLIAPVVRFPAVSGRGKRMIPTDNHLKLVGAVSFDALLRVTLRCAPTVGTKERRKRLSRLVYRPQPAADIGSFSIPPIAGKKIIEVPVIFEAGLRRFG
jgi:hypothetical protein